MKKIIAFGTFDLFHKGHISYLTQARALGDHLTVIIALDQTVKQIKGFHPHHTQEIRLQNVKNSLIADAVHLGNAENKHQVLLDHKPDIIALGYDQQAFTENLNKVIIQYGLTSEIIRLKSYFPQKYKTSYLKKQYANN